MILQQLVRQIRSAWPCQTPERRTPPRRVAKPQRRSIQLEPLEPRLLLSATAAVDAAGVLSIIGDNGADVISITRIEAVDAVLKIQLNREGLALSKGHEEAPTWPLERRQNREGTTRTGPKPDPCPPA